MDSLFEREAGVCRLLHTARLRKRTHFVKCVPFSPASDTPARGMFNLAVFKNSRKRHAVDNFTPFSPLTLFLPSSFRKVGKADTCERGSGGGRSGSPCGAQKSSLRDENSRDDTLLIFGYFVCPRGV